MTSPATNSDWRRAAGTRPLNPRACLECQKRKTRCNVVGESGSCTYCLRAKRRCVFEAAPARTPLTRKNLDALEKRCNHLEGLLRSMNLSGSVAAAVQTQQEHLEDDGPQGSLDHQSNSPDEQFNWNETPAFVGSKSPHDEDNSGLASMAVESSGYLGSSSASNIVQSIFPQEKPGSPPKNMRQRVSNISSHLRPQNFYLNASLLSSENTRRLVDAYFLYFNRAYPILHEHAFREQLQQRTRNGLVSCTDAIYYMVLAIGQWLLDEETQDSVFFNAARSWLSATALESGTHNAVQAFLLMGNYVQKRGRPNTGYNMIGIAYRMALGLGMHREVDKASRILVLAERRRQLFWTLFCFDSGLSITTGRPTTIIDSFMDVQMPRNVEFDFLDAEAAVPEEVNHPTTASAIIAQSQLAMIANEIQTRFWSLKSVQLDSTHDAALGMEVKLLNWRNSLPRYFTSYSVPDWFLGPRAVVIWKEQSLRMMMWRTHQRHNLADTTRAVADLKCYAAAVETVRDISEFRNENLGALHTGLAWYAIYYVFQAVLVLEISNMNDSGSGSGEADTSPSKQYETAAWSKAIEQGRACLQLLDKPTTAASRCLKTLDRVRASVQHNASSSPSQIDRLDRIRTQNQQSDESIGTGALQGAAALPPTGQRVVTENLSMQLDNAAGPPDDMVWMTSADSTLHMLLNDSQMDTFFHGMDGFPGTLDSDLYGYFTEWPTNS